MKRIAALLILVAMLFLVCPVYAMSPMNIVGDQVTAGRGETVPFSVSLNNNPGVAGFHIYLDYDQDVLTPTVDTDGAILIQKGNAATKGALLASETQTGCQIQWYHSENITTDGVLFTLSFVVNENANLEEYPISLRYAEEDTVNASGEQVSLLCTAGSVVVEEAALLKVDSISGHVGETVTVPVRLINNPGFAAFTFTVSYDSDSVKLAQIRKGPLLMSESGAFTRNAASGKVMWYDPVNTVGDGIILYLEFEILSREAYEACAVGVQLTNDIAQNFTNALATPVKLVSQNGFIGCCIGTWLMETVMWDSTTDTVVLMMKDAPKTEVSVICAVYEKEKMTDISVQAVVLKSGENKLPVDVATNGQKLRVFLLDQVWSPLSQSFEFHLGG